MKYIIVAILLIVRFSAIAQKADNFIDANGLKQGKWITRDTIEEALLIHGEGEYADNKKTGIWTYTKVDFPKPEKAADPMHPNIFAEEQLLSGSKLIRIDNYYADGSFITSHFVYGDKKISDLKYTADSSVVTGNLYCFDIDEKYYADCKCIRNKQGYYGCTLKSSSGKIFETFASTTIEGLLYNVGWCLYATQMKFEL